MLYRLFTADKDIHSSILSMPQITPGDLKGKIISVLSDANAGLWFPALTYDLAQTGWQKVKNFGINELEYGTLRVIKNSANAPIDIESTLLIRDKAGEVARGIHIELLPSHIRKQYERSGVCFYTQEELFEKGTSNNEILDCMRGGFEVISLLPSLFFTVVQLVSIIHLIKADSDDYDVSFSEPHIPFSIFISVPKTNSVINTLRVAEAIVHEAMHLQLSLVEYVVPLVTSDSEILYSPWKKEYRSVQGVIHALYVFGVLDAFFSELLKEIGRGVQAQMSKASIEYLRERRNAIAAEMREVKGVRESRDLSLLGRSFMTRLLGVRDQ